jgi:hypothetical protein
MTKKDKLREILRTMNGDAIDFSGFDAGVAQLRKSLEEKVAIPTLDKVNRELTNFKKNVDISPLVKSVEDIKSTVQKELKNISDKYDNKISALGEKSANDNETLEENLLKQLETEVVNLKVKIASIDYEDKDADIKKELSDLKKNINEKFANLKIPDDKEEDLKELKSILETTRLDLINQINKKGGGSMPRKISVSGAVMSNKYADFNLLGATATDNNTTKQVDITTGTAIGGTVTNGTANSVLFVNPTGILAQDNANFSFTDDSTKLFQLGSVLTGGQGITQIKGGVLGGSSPTDNFLNVTGTLPATVTAAQSNGVFFSITSAGTSNFAVRAVNVALNAGYTGGSSTFSMRNLNSAAGTGTAVWTGGNANYGLFNKASSVTIGHNIGLYNVADSSSVLNMGNLNNAISATSTPALNVGTGSLALNGTVNVAGFFGLMTTAPTLGTSTALIADNGATGADIFSTRSNGTVNFKVNDAGHLLVEGVTSTGATGTGKFVFDTAPQISTIELGNASDTTISRVSAGLIAVEGVTVVDVSSSQTLTNKTLTTPVINQINASANTSLQLNEGTYQNIQTYTPSAAGTATLDLSKGNIHHITMPAGNITIALSNGTAGQCFIIRILQDGTGSRTVTWFTTIKWAGGTAPTLTTTASKADTMGFEITGTNTYDGYVVGQNI